MVLSVRRSRLLAALALVFGFICAESDHAVALGETVVVEMRGPDGKPIGTINITETTSGLLLRAELKGLPPGPHGLQFHTAGACDGDFASAGDVYNPFGAQHGFLNPDGPKAGNLPNLIASASGDVNAEMITASVTLSKTAEEALVDTDGASLIVFENADDHITEPNGNAGMRIACGVINAIK